VAPRLPDPTALRRLLESESARRTVLQDNRFWKVAPMTDVPGVAHGIVEITKGQRNKFEIDKVSGLIRLDRYLSASCHYPVDYGFVPQTLAEDGDPLDLIVMVREPTFCGCLVQARVVGLLRMYEKGDEDVKVLAVPQRDPFFKGARSLDDLPQAFLDEVEHFFNVYKQLEGGKIETLGWGTTQEALALIQVSHRMYLDALEILAAAPHQG
jgi:inorganic pyrophosphatase